MSVDKFTQDIKIIIDDCASDWHNPYPHLLVIEECRKYNSSLNHRDQKLFSEKVKSLGVTFNNRALLRAQKKHRKLEQQKKKERADKIRTIILGEGFKLEDISSYDDFSKLSEQGQIKAHDIWFDL